MADALHGGEGAVEGRVMGGRYALLLPALLPSISKRGINSDDDNNKKKKSITSSSSTTTMHAGRG